MKDRLMHILIVSVLLLLSGSAAANPVGRDGESDIRAKADELLNLIEVSGGTMVHYGCGTGELTAALGENEAFTVQGLDDDPEKIDLARGHIAEQGMYGRVSADHLVTSRLPYGENQINVFISGEPVDSHLEEEIMRVLTPGGVMLVKGEEGWTEISKPRPEEIDAWTHYLHGSGNNAVARDSVVGPPQHLQWVSGPRYTVSHETNSSLAAMVSSEKRIYYIWDQSVIGIVDPRMPARWTLMARDAFNGRLLWERPMPDWGWRKWHDETRWDDPREYARMLRHLPSTLPRRLVVDEKDRLYVTRGYTAPVSILDGATGDTIDVLEETKPTDEILYAGDGRLVLSLREHWSDVWDDMPQGPVHTRIALMCADSGEEQWRSEAEPIAPVTLAAESDRVVYSTYEEVVCRDLSDGEELWRSDRAASDRGHRNTAGTLVVYGDTVLYTPKESGSGRLHAFSLESGELLWRTEETHTGPGISNPPDTFVAGGLVWKGDTRSGTRLQRDATDVRRDGRDPASGEVKRTVSVEKLKSPGHHYRCYRSKATERYILLPKRGVEFFDLEGDDHMRHDWLRAPCIYGVVPANGMLYVPPHQCVCYPGVLLDNFNALTTRVENGAEPWGEDHQRLERGPAWGKTQ